MKRTKYVGCFALSLLLLLGVLLVGNNAFSQVASAKATSRPTIKITSPVSNATITTGSTFTVATSSNVVRVDYSLVSDSGYTSNEFYLGSSTTRPFTFTWISSAAALYGGADLVARAYDAQVNTTTDTVYPKVIGTLNGPLPQAQNSVDRFPAGQTQASNGVVLNSKTGLFRFTSKGSFAEWVLEAPVAGTYQLIFRSAQFRSATGTVSINGAVVNRSLLFQAVPTLKIGTLLITPSTLPVTLKQGANVIRLTANDAAGLELDSLAIAQPIA